MCAAIAGPVRFVTVTTYAMLLSVSSYSKVALPPASGVPLEGGTSCAVSSVASSVTLGSSSPAARPADANESENVSTIDAARRRITTTSCRTASRACRRICHHARRRDQEPLRFHDALRDGGGRSERHRAREPRAAPSYRRSLHGVVRTVTSRHAAPRRRPYGTSLAAHPERPSPSIRKPRRKPCNKTCR